MAFPYPIISLFLISLSLLHIDASNHRSFRQAENNQCPFPNIVMCDYVQCANGRCTDDKNSSACYKCICSPGFTGQLCDVSIVGPSACNPGCQNGGQCLQTAANTSVCACPSEYTGNQCEISILATHPCVTNAAATCQNGGTCTINGADYACNCALGWTGKNCQTAETISSCNANPCGLHGTCVQSISVTGPVIFCNCENQWTGKFCDVNLNNPCSAGFCLSGGTCQLNGGIPFCNCPSTHTGPRCETLVGTINTTSTSTSTPSVGSCSTSSCLNGGQCFNTGNTFICLCRPEWSGPTCSTPNLVTQTPSPITPNPNACTPNPCLNGGTCYRYSNGHVCACTAQFTGPTCGLIQTTTASTATNACSSQPCKNGGTCYNSGSSYFCYCGSSSLLTGKNCETGTTTPPTNCPLNCGTGTCVNVGGQSPYACLCNGVLTPKSC